MSSLCQDTRIILCRTEGSRNIGSVCRAMKTMGFRDLILVNPFPINEEQVRWMAVHAFDVFENAQIMDNLADAVSDTVLAAGVTRRRGQRRKFYSLLPEQMADKASELKGHKALVFGNEQNGLNEEELACCPLAVHIPSNPEFPSLNLSHAVQILTYAFSRQEKKEAIKPYEPIARSEAEEVSRNICAFLSQAGYLKEVDLFNNEQYFRDILSRSGLSVNEAKHMKKLITALSHLWEKR